MSEKRTIIINADDVGMFPAVDTAVMQLVESGIVTSVSIMVLGKPDRDAMRTFKRYGVNIGMHLDLTSAMAAARYGIARTVSSTLLETYGRRMREEEARHIVLDQLNRFCDITGGTPAFIDGHEHVHQFPIIRDALIGALPESGSGKRPFIRNTRPRRWRGAKAALIGMLGARTLEKQARLAGCDCNTDFFGVYDLGKTSSLEQLWHAWLKTMPQQGSLVMCHPALSARLPHDIFRVREYRFLSSTLFEEMLYQYNTTVAGWETVGGASLPFSQSVA